MYPPKLIGILIFTILENNPELVKNQGIRPIISLFPVPEAIAGTGKRQTPETSSFRLKNA
jgi:hypothetical protein